VCDFSPPRGGNSDLLSEASILTPDIFSVAYSPGKSVRVNPVMVAHWIQENCNLPSIFTLATRDMNRGALQGILLGAQLLGLDNVVSVMGDDFTESERKLQVTVRDFSSTQLIKSIKDMNQRLDFRQRFLLQPTNFCVGATIDLSKGWAKEIALTKKKIDCGADFILSQPLFDPMLPKQFLGRYFEETGARLELPIMWGIQIKTKDSLTFTEIPDWIDRDLTLGRSGFDIALQVIDSHLDMNLTDFYIVPPAYSSGRRDYESAQAVIEELK
jgi:homocysteine S-methyltransferase